MIESRNRDMVRKVEDIKYAAEFAKVYNSANELYPINARYPADKSIFYKQMENDENYVYAIGKEIIGFMSYHTYKEYYELTSLYVQFARQRQQIGETLLNCFESKVPTDSLVIVKALNNSPWAINFYLKHSYMRMTEAQLQSLNIVQHNWETIL